MLTRAALFVLTLTLSSPAFASVEMSADDYTQYLSQTSWLRTQCESPEPWRKVQNDGTITRGGYCAYNYQFVVKRKIRVAQPVASMAQASVSATAHISRGQEVMEQIVPQVGTKAGYFLGGPAVGWGVCGFTTYTGMLVYKDRHHENWSFQDTIGNMGLSVFRCSPIGFIEDVVNGRDPFEKGLAVAGGLVGFNVIQGSPATAITLTQTGKQIYDNLPHQKNKSPR
jgi:hypothetical protein